MLCMAEDDHNILMLDSHVSEVDIWKNWFKQHRITKFWDYYTWSYAAAWSNFLKYEQVQMMTRNVSKC